MTVIGFYPAQGTIYTPEILAKVKRVTEALEQLPGVKPGSVLSLMSPRVKDVHSTDDSLEITPLAAKVPETDAEMRRVPRAREGQLLSSPACSSATTAARPRSWSTSTTSRRRAAAKASTPSSRRSSRPSASPGWRFFAAGAPTILHWLLVYTRRVAVLFVLALAMIGYLHYRAFRTLQGMIVPLVTAIMGVVWALGLMGLIGAPMDPWNIMTPILLLAIGAGHSVQILKRYYEEYGRLRASRPDLSPAEHNRLAVIEATVKVGVVMLAAGTIASLSFGSLATFGLPTIKNFGLCTAFGIVAALTVEMTFIPAIRVLMSPPSRAPDRAREARGVLRSDPREAGAHRAHRQGAPDPLGLLGAHRGGAGRRRRASRPATAWARSSSRRNAPVHGFRMADSRLAGTRVIQVLIEGDAPDAIKNPEVLAGWTSSGRFIAHQPLPVGKVVSIVDLLKQMSLVIDNTGGGKLPDTAQGVAQYLLLYAMGGDEEDLAPLRRPRLPARGHHRLSARPTTSAP